MAWQVVTNGDLFTHVICICDCICSAFVFVFVTGWLSSEMGIGGLVCGDRWWLALCTLSFAFVFVFVRGWPSCETRIGGLVHGDQWWLGGTGTQSESKARN